VCCVSGPLLLLQLVLYVEAVKFTGQTACSAVILCSVRAARLLPLTCCSCAAMALSSMLLGTMQICSLVLSAAVGLSHLPDSIYQECAVCQWASAAAMACAVR
jgi:hypothetical protein